ncbi:uncharacterized protein LOC120766093 isoform X2 [Hirundo rustica]|uniref:uncharacterized protein LOC120766093 isoform X2 n=1 Tax=Hirundo rustica TaxID=43150 RepID=UPI0026737DC7|nr:uncharacterized protein LOC120766093 isoform X2 [Hirundo rustica]
MVLGSFWRSRCCKSLAQLLGDTGPLMSIDCACGGPGHVGIPGRRRFCPGVSAVTPKVGEVLGMTQGDFGETILQTHTCVESSVAVLSVAEWLEGLARADQGMEESAPAGSLANAGRELTQNFLGPWQREREAANGVGSVSGEEFFSLVCCVVPPTEEKLLLVGATARRFHHFKDHCRIPQQQEVDLV